MNSRKPWLLSVSGPPRLACALPNSPNRITILLIRWHWCCRLLASPPEFARREPGAFGEAGEFRPHDARIDRRLADPGAIAAITAGDDVLTADKPRITADALRDQLRVLDEIGLRFNHPGYQHLAFRQFHILENPPFMCMARVGRLKGQSARLRQKNRLDDVSERHIAMVRSFVIAPAQMQPHPVGRNIREGVIERLYVQPCLLAELGDA